MAYNPTNWSAGQSITADLMNKIEQGIKNAVDDSSEAKQTAQGASQTVNGFQATLTDHDGRLEDLENAADTNDVRIQQGVDAWAQVKPTLTYSGNNITKTLKKRLEDDEDIVDKIRVNVEGAKRTTQDSLSKRFNDLDDSIDLINSDISTINETFRSAAGSSYNDIQSRFNADEDLIDDLDTRLDPIEAQMKKALTDRNYTGASALDDRFKATENKLTAAKTSDYFPGQEFTLDGRFENIEKEIVTARTSDTYGSTSNNPVVYTSLDQRFEEIEKEIKAGRGGNNNLITHFNELNDDKVNYTDIVNGVNYTGDAQKKALDAKQGKALNDRITTVISNYESADAGLSERITTLETNVNGAKIINGAQTLDKRFYDIDGGSKPDRNLPSIITEIEGAHTSGVIKTSGGQDTPYDDLDDRFSAIENYAVWTRTKLTNAFSSHTNAVDGEDTVYTDLDERLETIEGVNKTQDATLGKGFDTGNNTVAKKIEAAESAAKDYADNKFGTEVGTGTNQTNGTVTAQMNAVRGRINSLEGEVSAAHVDNATTLDARFDAIDGGSKATKTIPQLISSIAEKVAKTDIKKTLAYDTDDNTVLQARQGKILKDTIGGTYSTSNTVASAIDALDTRLDKVDGGSALTGTTLATRVSNAESKITTLNGDANTSGSVLNTVNSRIAEVVDGAPGAFDTLKEIADWIGENSDDALTMQTNISNNASAISGLDTRLTAIDNNTNGRMKAAEDNINTINGKLGNSFDTTTNGTVSAKMAALRTDMETADGLLDGRLDAIEDNLNDQTDGLNARMATAEDDIDALETALGDNNSGITGRVTTLEGIVNHQTTGLAATKAIADANKSAIENSNTGLAATKAIADQALSTANNAATASDLSTLTGRVTTAEGKITALEGKDTIVIDYDGVNSNYTTVDNKKVPNIDSANIKANADYLIEDTDEKYYYWRFINNEWKLISGAGSGAGNSNAEDYATIAAFEQAEKELNKDYYVLDNNGFRHHYRYLSTAITAQPIEIGISPSLVKSYQIDTSEGVNNQQEQTQYLDFYGFDLGQVPTTINPEDHLSYRLAHIPLPKGGGESSGAYRIYAKVKDGQTRRVSYSDIRTNGLVLEYSYTCCSLVDGEYAYKAASWTLSTDGEIIESSNGVVDPLDKTVAAAGQSSYDAGAINITTSNLFKYCQKNQTTTFNLTLHVETGENEDAIADRTISVYVTAVELSLASTFSDQRTYNNGNNLQIPYTFTGMSGQEPVFEVLLDNISIAPSITSTDINIRSTTLANLTGVHNLSIRASQQVSGATLYSNALNYQLGLIDSQSNDILIFSGASLENQLVEQYHVLKLPYYLYVPNNEEIEVTFTVEQVVGNVRERVASLSRPNEMLTTGAYEYTFRIYEMIANEENYILTINADNASLVFNITALRAAEEINIKKENLVFDFKPDQFNNNTSNEEDRLWQYKNGSTTYKMRIPEGSHFDWRTGGWITVTEGNKTDIPCFCVRAGSRVEFVKEENGVTTPLTLFWPNMESQGGSNFKCTFKIDNVKTPDAPFLTSLDNTVNTVINYGPLILSEKQDVEDDDTLLYNYLGVKYIYTETINNKNKVVKEAIGTTVLNSNPFSAQLTEALRSASEDSARSKNGKKIKSYISNIYDIANQASVPAHREYLLKILSGKDPDNSTIDASTIKSEITSYLFDENAYNANDGSITSTVAQQVYNTLVSAGEDPNSTIYAYRHLEPVNFDALLNGFIVEGKDGKDGIIAMMLFTFASSIQAPSNFTQTVSENPISTNSFAKTGTFEVTVTDTRTNITKKYDVEMVDKSGTGVYTEIKSIRDASNTENKAYGLELNALGSNIYLPSGVVNYPYSEGDIIEFEYNVNAPIRERINSSVIIYEDGVPSAAKLYTVGNNTFEQNSPGYLTIGSDDCDVYIYKMRLYDKALENSEILKNFYADGLTVDDMSARYSRNKNLVNAVKNNTITPQLVAEECPDLRIIMIEAPTLTGGKTSFIKNTKIRCIYKNGRPEDNWVALNAYHAGQGTSSDNYGAAGRNLDIIFGFDGEDTVIIPKPQKNNYTFDPTYRSIVITGLDDDNSNDIRTAAEYEADGYNVVYNEPGQPTGKVSLTSTSVPNNWFNIKVNIASSENVNNAYLQKRFDRYLPYKDIVPARVRGREEDIDIKNDMEFFNCVIFIKETGTASEFVDDNEIDPSERGWHFYGIGNIGDSKKTDNTRVNVKGDPYEFGIEITDNGLLLSGFNTGVFYISEASKIRSQTPRNQANGNADIPEALAAQTGHICINGEYTVSNNSYTFSIINPSVTTMYFVPVSGETYYRRFMYVNNTWTEVGEPISFLRTSYGVKYPISQAEWTIQNSENKDVNTYHSALYDFDSGKGWDKSFEFRYDITTKDGETVARDDIEEAMNYLHQKANKKAFADMYSWIATASNTEFRNNLDSWFIKESPLYWYLFTERYTMIDSRAKNTFYHYGKVYISQYEYDGHVLEDLNNITPAQYALAHNLTSINGIDAETIATEEIKFKKDAAQFIYDNRDTFIKNDGSAAINDGYRFELWDYDMDTALGINNNGQMVFSAGLEDIDKDITGWIYNEAESVIWRRVRENMYPELGALYVRLKTECFNAENLIQEFDMLQNQFPEELWRMDFERKYYRPFYEKNETTYLNDMANGRKRYQRRQFERNMAVYINSKYQRNGSYEPNDLISFRPQFDWRAGLDTTIIIKPYSTMYINFALGNYDNTTDVVSNVNSALSVRVNRGEEYRIEVSDYINEFRNIQCIIYNASRLMSIDGLGKFYCQQFILGAAKKLTTLILGNSDPDYTNRSMNEIGKLGLSAGLPLLETLDLQNIEFQNAPETFALENFPLLKNLNASGCNIRSFTFKDGGMLEKVTFPSGLTKIDFKNLYNLVDTMDENENIISAVTLTGASNLISYNSENSYSNSYQIVQNMLNNAGINRITLLKLNDIDWVIGNIEELDSLKQLKEKLKNNMSIAGKIKILGKWSTVEINNYLSIWPNLQFDVTEGTEEQKYRVIFKYDDYIDDEGNTIYGEELMTLYVKNGDIIRDIWEYDDNGVKVHMLDEMPQRNPTAHSVYQFGLRQYSEYIPYSGWKYAGEDQPISETPNRTPIANSDNIVIETWFKVDPHKYPVKWYLWRNKPDSQSLVKISNIEVDYGGGYELEAPTITEIHNANAEIGKPNFDTYEVTINGGTVSYKIFDGWEKLPTNITPSKDDASYNIYANWHEKSIAISDLYTENDNLSDEERLLVLSAIDSTTEGRYNPNIAKNIAVSSRVNFTLGQDIDRPGASRLVAPDAVFRTDKASGDRIETTIQPFRAENNAFTIAIDYCFKENMLYDAAKNNAILASCYYQNNTTNEVSGFALYYNLNTANGVPIGPRVGFGDMFNRAEQSVPVGKAIPSITTYDELPQGVESREALTTPTPLGATRNIIVLRHEQDSEILYVYSGFGTENGIPSEVSVQQLSWDNVVNDAYINFGQLTASNAEDYEGVKNSSTKAHGTIYWAKYWPEDLGAGECIRIASWPHETMTYAISVLSNSRTGDYRITSPSPSIYFTSLETSAHGKVVPYVPSTNNYNTRGWGTSDMRAMCNNRLFAGLPTRLQSILCKTTVNYKTASPVTSSNGIDQYALSANPSVTRDYVYMNTIVNIQPSSTELNVYSNEESVSSAKPFAWLGDAASIQILSYKTGGGWDDITNSSDESNKVPYYNLRFPYQPIKWASTEGNQMRIFKERSVSFPSNTTAYNRINMIAGGIKVGDILMLPNRSGNIRDMAYIYVSDEDIRDYGAQVMPNLDVFACESGGWVPSSDYWTRSMGTGNYNSSFCYVDNRGIVSKTGTGASSYGLGLNYSFSM